ncbi:type II toxin-antitoxin system VapC family toxin [Sphingomonas adhaesiva]|uniref:type II toxin-antitoxin system VapC family toxin n=1 Tax=Sphingomonas adhaesiva TaxID=28212 RepID=UPI002FFB21A5
MIVLVDSSVWIDLFRSRSSPSTTALEYLLRKRRVAIGDLILTEVLQGFTSDAAFDRARQILSLAAPLTIVDDAVALQAAINYRTLRALGITIRKTIDTLIATRCILDRIPLLYSDRDFDPFVQHLGLRSAMDLPGVT